MIYSCKCIASHGQAELYDRLERHRDPSHTHARRNWPSWMQCSPGWGTSGGSSTATR